jgi:hypothetical protein
MLTSRPIAEILADFRKPIDPKVIAQLPIFSKGEQVGSVPYIHWYDLIDVLNFYAPGWSWEVRTQFLPDRCVIEGRLTIRAQEGEFPMEAVGVEMLDSNGYGDPVYSAEASALRRAMAKFGYALELWRKDKRSRSPQNSTEKSFQVIKTPTEIGHQRVTQKQLNLLCAIANERELVIDTDLRVIVSSFGYQSKKDIAQKDLDAIIAATKQAGKFLTLAQRKELADWWRTEAIDDAMVKRVLEGTGFNTTANIPRDRINDVKRAILEAAGKINQNNLFPKSSQWE